MEGPDRAAGQRKPRRRPGDSHLRDPGPSAYILRIPISSQWPEAVAWCCGLRLYQAGADDVPLLMRQGLPYVVRLEADEVEAHLLLGAETFERWFRAGWAAAAYRDEGG